MHKKLCPNCSTPLNILPVVFAINPARIPCGNCKQHIKIKNAHAIAAIIIAIISTIILLLLLSTSTNNYILIWCALLASGVILEMLYFVLIHKGIIKSTLIDADHTANSTSNSSH